MALVTQHRASPPFVFDFIYNDANNAVQRIVWANNSTDQLFRAKLINPAGKVLVNTGVLQPGQSGAVDIAPPDRFSWEDDGLTTTVGSGPVGG